MKALAARIWADHNQTIIAVIVTAVIFFFVYACVQALVENSIRWLFAAAVTALLMWMAAKWP